MKKLIIATAIIATLITGMSSLKAMMDGHSDNQNARIQQIEEVTSR